MSKSLLRKGAGEQGSRGEGASPLLPFSLSPFLLFAATLWLYRRALGFAYFNDDPSGHFAWMEGRTLLDFFAGSADYGYYRPVVFAVLRLTELLFGNETFPHNPAADHALLLLLHAANAVLVWALARRAGRDELFALSAALIFAFVPFSYEAVAYVASLTHPLVVFWVLLGLWVYGKGLGIFEKGRRGEREKGRLTTGYWLLVTVLIITCLALLTHENGLFILPALVGYDWLLRPRDGLRGRARRLWPFAVPPALFAALWLLVPKSSEQGLNGLTDIGRNIVPFLQTLVYPLLPVVRLDAGDVGLLVALAVVVVGGLGLLAWRAGAWRLWAFALGWFVLSSLPALLFLGPAYVYGSPRLSYLPSVGAALLWALPVVGLRLAAGRRPVAHLLLSIFYLAAVLLPPLPFIHCQLDFYEATSDFARGMAGAAGGAPAGRDVVFVNAPFFFSSTAARPDGCPSAYPWTPVGGVLIPPYAQARDFVRFNGGPDRPVTGVTFDGYGPGWRTFGPAIDGETLRAHAAEDAPFVFDLLDGSFADLRAAWQPGAGEAAEPAATFGEALALSDATLDEEGEWLAARLAWRVLAETAEPLVAFIHVYDASGALVAQSDGPPGDALAPQALWRAGDGLADARRIDLSALPPGAYRVAVGVYDAANGARLPASVAGAPLPDDIYPIGIVER